MISLDFLSILLLLSMGQCVFLIVTVLLNKIRSRPANMILGLLLFAFLWYQLEFFLIRNTLDANIPFLYSTRYGSWLLIGPLVFLYNRASLIYDFKITRNELLHFVPFLLLTMLLPMLFNGFVTSRAVDYGMLTVFDGWNSEPITWKHYLYGFIFIAQFLHAFIYLIISHRETARMVSQAKDYLSTVDESVFKTQKYLLIGGAIILLLCSSFITYQFITSIYRRNGDYFYVIPMMIVVYGLLYRAIRYPNAVLNFQEMHVKKKYEKSSLAPVAAEAYLEKLEKKIEEEKVYRNNELRLNDLAQQLDMTTHHLSQVINENLNKNFFDYINAFRVKEAKQLIKKEEGKNLLEIAYSVGFNNKNSFNNAFKKHTGMNPSSYKKEAITG